jgi:hypothetical protein
MLPEESPEYLAKLAQLEQLDQRLENTHTRKIHKARRNYADFAELVLKDEFSGTKIKLARLHYTWIKHIQTCWERGLHAGVQSCWGSGKTSLIAIGLPLFALGVQPSLRIKLISASDDTARERLALIRRYIEDSEELKEIFPHLRPSEHQDWTRTRLFIERPVKAKDASIEAKGILSSAMGGRADLLIIDDINDPRNTLWQPRLRNIVFNNFTGTFLSRLEPRGRVAMISTRWHVSDVPGRILADPLMQRAWGFLTQRVSEDFTQIECEYLYGRATGSGAQSRKDQLLNLYDLGIISSDG